MTMVPGGLDPLLVTGLVILAMAFGAIVALIFVELQKRSRCTQRSERLGIASRLQTGEEKKRRQDLVVQLMALYSGVHSTDALSDFLNKELERRFEPWRVRIPVDGPGEIYDLDSIQPQVVDSGLDGSYPSHTP